jgi:hypothetical protein
MILSDSNGIGFLGARGRVNKRTAAIAPQGPLILIPEMQAVVNVKLNSMSRNPGAHLRFGMNAAHSVGKT